MPLLSSEPTLFRELPGFLSPFVTLNRPSVLLNEHLLEEVAHRAAYVGWVLSAGLRNARSSQGGRHHVPIGPFIVGQKVEQNTILGGDVHLGNLARHACCCSLHVFKTLCPQPPLILFEHLGKKPFIGTKVARTWQNLPRPARIENTALSSWCSCFSYR